MSDKKPILRVHYVDQPKYDPKNHRASRILKQRYDVIFDSKEPDIVFLSSWGWERLYYKDPVKVLWSSENEYPDFNICDYALSHMRDSVGGRNYWWPFYMTLPLKETPIPNNPLDRQFASFLANSYNHYGSRYRADFVSYLMENYKRVDCPGHVLHNIDVPDLEPRSGGGNWNDSKRAYIGRYKFNIAFENSNTDGYITEKLPDCFMANTIPIYWGSEGNTAPFPKEAMICANDYPDFDSLIARIKEVDENDELYLSILRANPLHNKDFIAQNTKHAQGLTDFLYKIADEALHRKNLGGCQMRRSIGNLRNIVDSVSNIETSRIIDAIFQKLEEQRKEQDKLSKFAIAIMSLPTYKRQFFWTRILSHLFPTYRGGVYTKKKRKLRNLINEIEMYVSKTRDV